MAKGSWFPVQDLGGLCSFPSDFEMFQLEAMLPLLILAFLGTPMVLTQGKSSLKSASLSLCLSVFLPLSLSVCLSLSLVATSYLTTQET